MLIIGVDEAGRGPLAGPVYAAAVILNPKHPIPGLMDSKKLSAKRRNDLFEEIQAHALAFAIASASVAEIDKLNILQASLLAMQRAITSIQDQGECILIDGNQVPIISTCLPMQAIVGGDAIEPAISAASILAKVSRDAEMARLDLLYPQYGFKQHQGYPTAKHRANLIEHGPSLVHRLSYAPVKAAQELHSLTVL